jgi:hypothetical protein
MVSPEAGRQLEVCGLSSSPSSTSTELASTAANCGAKPWSEVTNVLSPRSLLCTNERNRSAPVYARSMKARRFVTRWSRVPLTCTSSYAGLRSPFGSRCETRPRNWCWSSSVTG